MALQYHLQMDSGGVTPCVVLPGEPQRGETVASFWDEAHHMVTNGGYVTHGDLQGVPIVCASTGMFGDFRQSWWWYHLEDLKRLNAVGAGMEASLTLVLAQIWELRTGGAVVVDDVLEVSGEFGQFDPEDELLHGAEPMEKPARLRNATIRHLDEANTA